MVNVVMHVSHHCRSYQGGFRFLNYWDTSLLCIAAGPPQNFTHHFLHLSISDELTTNNYWLKTCSAKIKSFETPGVPFTYSNDGGVRQRFIFYTQENPNFRICLPKKIPTFFSIPKKIPQCFCISKFYYLSSEITESAAHLCMGS